MAPQDMDREERRNVVCFVDDDDRLRTVVARLLHTRGFDVVSAGSASDAVDLVESHAGELDLLLMDINLPDGWGADLAEQLCQIRPDMVVVYTTGFAEIDPILAGGLRDARFVVRKPFTVKELVEVLTLALAEKGAAENRQTLEE